MRRLRTERGFTLLEMLVALALFGLLALVLYSGVRDGVRAHNTVEMRSDDRANVVFVQSFLRDRLAGLGPAPERAPDDTGPAWFDGGADRLAITAPWLEALPVAGIYRVEFVAVQEPDRLGAMVIRWRLETTGGEAGAPTAGQRIVLDEIRLLRFSYFGAAEPGKAKEWHPAWRSNRLPPDLVRLEIGFADATRTWPTLTIAIP
jgi:general secretion pathway protein J